MTATCRRILSRVLLAIGVLATFAHLAAAAAPPTGKAACTAVQRKAKARLEKGLVACAQRGGSADVAGCSGGQWQRYTRRLARRGCKDVREGIAQQTIRRPVLAKVRAEGVGADDLALADADTRAAHLELRDVLQRLARAADAVRAGRGTAQSLMRFGTDLEAAIDRLEAAEETLTAVETALWKGFRGDVTLPWLVDEPLWAAMEQVQVELRRLLGPEWRTEIAALRAEPACSGDLIGDRLVAGYGKAVVSTAGDRSPEVAALGRVAAQLACLSFRQASLFDVALGMAYDLVAVRLERAGLGRVQGAFARLFAPLELLVFDTVKHAGERAHAHHWFKDRRLLLLDEVERLGWATGDVVWLYDRIDGRMIGFPPCAAGEDGGRCVELPALLESLGDPRAIGLGDCALSGLVAGGVRSAGGSERYACPSADCSVPSPTSGRGGGIGSRFLGRGPGRPAFGSSGRTGGSSAFGSLPWSGLTPGDQAIMYDLGCGGGAGGGGGSSGGEGGATQGPGGSRGDWGGTEECVQQALVAPRDPYGAFVQCAVAASGHDQGPASSLTQSLRGVPMGPSCRPGVADDSGSSSSTTTPTSGGSAATSTTVSADGPSTPSTTEPPAPSPPCVPSGILDAISKILDCGLSSLQMALSAETPKVATKGGPSPASAAGAVVQVEIELLKPENAQNVYDFMGARVQQTIELECTGDGALSAGECATLRGMKPGDAGQYLRQKGLMDCADPEHCESACTSLNGQVLERMQDCQRELTDALRPDPTPIGDPGPRINPDPDAVSGGLPDDPLLGCLLGEASAGGSGGIDMSCAFVSCTDGPATARSASACCGAVAPGIGLSIDRIMSERTCQQVQCTGGEAAIADDLGDCGCGGGAGVVEPSGPAPQPGPPQR